MFQGGDRCEPPDGTPAGTVCVLRNEYGEHHVKWTGRNWHAGDSMFHVAPETLSASGWRFVRVAGEGYG